MGIEWKNNINFDAMIKKYQDENEKALKKLAYEILSDILNTPPRPPIMLSALWGSGSVFVGNKVVAFGKDMVTITAQAAPNTSLSETDGQKITVGFNVEYAKKMHEHEWNWGKRSLKAGGVGSKFIQRHIEGNSAKYLIEYAVLVKKGMGM